MESISKFYIIGASENICKWILMNFFEKLCFEKRESINVFWKGNKTKGGSKDALYSQAKIDISPKITSQPEFFL